MKTLQERLLEMAEVAAQNNNLKADDAKWVAEELTRLNDAKPYEATVSYDFYAEDGGMSDEFTVSGNTKEEVVASVNEKMEEVGPVRRFNVDTNWD